MLIYLIVGVIAGIIGANMAKSRKQNPAIWFIVCFIFPIAVFGLLFIEKKEDLNDEKATKVIEQENKFSISFQMKNEESWLNLKIKLFEFYKQQNIENIISDKENSWMLGSNESPGYIEAKIDNNVITVVSFKLSKPDISIIESETKQKESPQPKESKQSTEVDTTAKLIDLANMLDKGLLSKEEFEKMKKELIR